MLKQNYEIQLYSAIFKLAIHLGIYQSALYIQDIQFSNICHIESSEIKQQTFK